MVWPPTAGLGYGRIGGLSELLKEVVEASLEEDPQDMCPEALSPFNRLGLQ